nr:hypothetical protein GCM10020093_002580 [Planobispora longispora]
MRPPLPARGEAADLRFFVRLHRALEPLPVETAVHVRDYLRLIPAAPGPVAELALRHVRDVCELRELRELAGLGPADLVEGVEAAVFRPERKLARSGLTWLDRTVRRAPDLADDLAPALTTALGHEERDIRESPDRGQARRALHPRRGGTSHRGRGRPPPELTARLAIAFGAGSPDSRRRRRRPAGALGNRAPSLPRCPRRRLLAVPAAARHP